MGEGLNKVMLIGHLGADPELRFTQSGQGVMNLRLATSETYLDKDQVRKERTEWHNVTIWGKRAEGLHKFLRKGSPIYIEGRLQTSSYEDRDGAKRYKTEVIATNVILLPGRGSERGGEERSGEAPAAGERGSGYNRAPSRGSRGGERQPRGYDDHASDYEERRGHDQGGRGQAAPADDYGDYSGGDGSDDIPF